MTKLFSIKEKYSKKIYSKEKLVEFRRQNINIKTNELCLIYTNNPVKKITGYFIVKEKIRASILLRILSAALHSFCSKPNPCPLFAILINLLLNNYLINFFISTTNLLYSSL